MQMFREIPVPMKSEKGSALFFGQCFVFFTDVDTFPVAEPITHHPDIRLIDYLYFLDLIDKRDLVPCQSRQSEQGRFLNAEYCFSVEKSEILLTYTLR